MAASTTYEQLLAWEEARKAREANEKAVSETILTNMEEKLEMGKNSCQELSKYVKEMVLAQKEFVKTFNKLGSSLNEHLFYGSLQTAVVALKKQNTNTCNLYDEHSKALNDNADQLAQLASDYASTGSKLLETSKKLGKDIDNNRGAIGKNFSAYITAHDDGDAAAKAGKVPTQDAWFAERAYHQSLTQAKAEKEKITSEMGALFEKFLKLEEKRIDTTKLVLKQHATKQRDVFGKLNESTVELSIAVDAVINKTDQQHLVQTNFNRNEITISLLQKHKQALDAQAQSASNNKSNTQPQQDQGLIQQHNQLQSQLLGVPQPTDVLPNFVSEPTKTGPINRQSSVIKSWRKNHFVLTPGFLYIFVNQEDAAPEYTLPLINISIQHLQGNNEEPNVFEIIVNPNSFFSSSRYVFKADNDGHMNEWISAIKSCSGIK